MTIPGRLITASRRRFLAGAAALAVPVQPITGKTEFVEVAARPGTAGDVAMGPAFLDGPLLAEAFASCDVERRTLALVEGPGRIVDNGARDRVLEPLRGEQLPHLDALRRLRARTPAGHAARASAFLLRNAGELACQAEVRVSLDDRLLWDLACNLAVAPC